MVDVRKKVNKLLSKARNEAKPDKCILCGKSQTSFCNSHSVSQLSLKNIAENGKVLYKKLRHQLNSTSKQKVLQLLNYIVFAYAENYFIFKTIQLDIESNEKLIQLAQENTGYPNLGFLGPDNFFGMKYQPIQMNEIPNFLDIDWAVA